MKNIVDSVHQMTISFNLSFLSAYRKELMGVAAILILFCHAPGNNVMMPALIGKILSYGNVGVDMFLLISGMGLFYSLSNKPAKTSLISWYTKRFIRILIPYWLILIPYLIYKVCDRGYSLDDVFLNLTAMSYWLSGDGDWFISLILLLYIITPPLFAIINEQKDYKRWCIVGLLCILFSLLSEISSSHEGLMPFCKAIARAPAFLVGAGIVPYVKSGYKIDILYLLLVIPVLLILYNLCFPHGNILWILSLPVMLASCILVEKFILLKIVAAFMGVISLESYLWNVHLGAVLNYLSWQFGKIDLSYGHYIEYLTVLILGLLLSYMFYKVYNRVVEQLNKKLAYNE